MHLMPLSFCSLQHFEMVQLVHLFLFQLYLISILTSKSMRPQQIFPHCLDTESKARNKMNLPLVLRDLFKVTL